jgi:cell division protein FtsQ
MKRLKNILVVVCMIVYLIVVLGLTSDNSKNRICNKIDIHIADSLENGFLTSDDILEMVHENYDKILGYPIGKINSEEMETRLRKHPSVRKAEVFICADGSLNIDIEQRKAILRIINHRQESYYVSADGAIIPWSEKFTARVLIANGYIPDSYDSDKMNFVDQAGKESMIKWLYELANYIEDNQFWKAQIEQIYVTRSGELELIPRVGPHVIQFGIAADFERKFRKLLAFYEQGLSKTGWNKYKTLNLKYEGQIVCTLR